MPIVEAPQSIAAATSKAKKMLAVAPHLGVDLDVLEAARRRLEAHEAEYDRSFGAVRRNELAQLMAIDVAELAAAYRKMEVAVERGGEA